MWKTEKDLTEIMHVAQLKTKTQKYKGREGIGRHDYTVRNPGNFQWPQNKSQPGNVMTGCIGKMHNTKRLEINPSFLPGFGEIPSTMWKPILVTVL